MATRSGNEFPYEKGYLFPFACFACRKSFKRAFRWGDAQRKCPHCGATAEVWTRVMGYHRPVSSFNPGKQSEHRERMFFAEPATSECPS